MNFWSILNTFCLRIQIFAKKLVFESMTQGTSVINFITNTVILEHVHNALNLASENLIRELLYKILKYKLFKISTAITYRDLGSITFAFFGE